MEESQLQPDEPWVSVVERKLRSRRLCDVIAALQQYKTYQAGRCGLEINAVFEELRGAFAKGDRAGEQLLRQKNTPPLLTQSIEGCGVWIGVSSDIFLLNPELPDDFATDLLDRCVSTPTHPEFSLLHVDTMATLVFNQLKNVSFSKCRAAITQHTDSRALYALGALRSYPHWSEIRGPICDCLLSAYPIIRGAAYWVLRERASVEELKMLFAERGYVTDDCITTRSMLDALVLKHRNRTSPIFR